MTTKPQTARIEVFRPGTFKPMEGDPITYSAADLRAIADAYDPDTAPAPIVIGHPDTDAPAFGWVDRLEYDQSAERLFADRSKPRKGVQSDNAARPGLRRARGRPDRARTGDCRSRSQGRP